MSDEEKNEEVEVAPGVKVRLAKLDEFEVDPDNTRYRGAQAKETIKNSLARFGGSRSIVVDGDGVIRAGNGTLEGARETGMEEAIEIETDGKRLVIVKRPEWTEDEARLYSVTDNRATDLSKFDYNMLAEEARTQVERIGAEAFQMLGWEEYQLSPLLEADFIPPDVEPLGDGDAGGGSGQVIKLTEDDYEEFLLLAEQHEITGSDPAKLMKLLALIP